MKWYILNFSKDQEESLLNFFKYKETSLSEDSESYSWRVYKANDNPLVIYLETDKDDFFSELNDKQLLPSAPKYLDTLEIISQG